MLGCAHIGCICCKDDICCCINCRSPFRSFRWHAGYNIAHALMERERRSLRCGQYMRSLVPTRIVGCGQYRATASLPQRKRKNRSLSVLCMCPPRRTELLLRVVSDRIHFPYPHQRIARIHGKFLRGAVALALTPSAHHAWLPRTNPTHRSSSDLDGERSRRIRGKAPMGSTAPIESLVQAMGGVGFVLVWSIRP